MKFRIEDLSPVSKRIEIEIPPDQVDSEIDATYCSLAKRVKVKGFRPGKVPRNILEQYYGSAVQEEVLSKLVNDSYQKAIDEGKVVPISRPVLNNNGRIERGKEFRFSATVEVEPRIEPRDYLELKIESQKVNISPEQVKQALAELQNHHAQFQQISEKRPLRRGDFALVDFQGFLDDVPQEDEKGEDYIIEIDTGPSSSIFGDSLIGMNVGEEREINVTHLQDHPKKKIAGKEMKYQVKLKEIKEKILPKLDDEFAKDLGKFESLEELEKELHRQLESQEEARVKDDLKEKIVSQIIANNPVEIPPSLVEAQINFLIAQRQRLLEIQGLDPGRTDIGDQELREKFRETAIRRIKAGLLMEAIADQEKIEVNEQDITDRLEGIALREKRRVEEIREYYRKQGLLESLRAQIKEEKTLDYLISKAELKELA
ncbi:MAG: trigger factor [Deltaproteobacteria bacterium]|nr:MAG: trigger factor [Deltaproteobacteria bacterium]